LFLWRDEDSTQQTIADDTGVTQQSISEILSLIARKVVKQYELIYEDWLYLNYLRGTYKTCSKCGEVKLVSKYSKDSTRKDGLDHKCKNCRILG
jgi:hypothetical protein